MTPTDITAVVREPRAASPVIGIVLMVSVTVILAAAIGTFVIGVGDRLDPTAPAASFEYQFESGVDGWTGSGDWVNITFSGGDQIGSGEIRITIDGEDVDGVGGNWSDQITAGDTVRITDDTTATGYATVSAIDRGDTIQIIWTRADVEKSIVIGEREVP